MQPINQLPEHWISEILTRTIRFIPDTVGRSKEGRNQERYHRHESPDIDSWFRHMNVLYMTYFIQHQPTHRDHIVFKYRA